MARKIFAASFSKIACCHVSIGASPSGCDCGNAVRRKCSVRPVQAAYSVAQLRDDIVRGSCVCCLRCVTGSRRKCRPWSPPFSGWACVRLIIISLINMQNGAGPKDRADVLFSLYSIGVHTSRW